MKGSKTPATRYFLDTNVFLRTIVRDKDVARLEACRSFLTLVRGGRVKAFTSSLVLAEVAWVLMSFYRLPKEEALRYVNAIVSLKHLTFEDNTRVRAALELWSEYPVKFIDCLFASHPKVRRGAAIVVSYDRDFDRIAGVIRKEPQEIR